MEECFGKKYFMTNSEHFEDYLIFIGIGYLSRKVAVKLKQTHRLTLNSDGTYTFEFMSQLASSTNTFTSGVEFEEESPDGSKMRSTITIDGNIMTHLQIQSNGKTSTHVREFHADKMVTITTGEGFDKVMTRYYVVID